jgi:hypothetical protein
MCAGYCNPWPAHRRDAYVMFTIVGYVRLSVCLSDLSVCMSDAPLQCPSSRPLPALGIEMRDHHWGNVCLFVGLYVCFLLVFAIPSMSDAMSMYSHVPENRGPCRAPTSQSIIASRRSVCHAWASKKRGWLWASTAVRIAACGGVRGRRTNPSIPRPSTNCPARCPRSRRGGRHARSICRCAACPRTFCMCCSSARGCIRRTAGLPERRGSMLAWCSGSRKPAPAPGGQPVPPLLKRGSETPDEFVWQRGGLPVLAA